MLTLKPLVLLLLLVGAMALGAASFGLGVKMGFKGMFDGLVPEE